MGHNSLKGCFGICLVILFFSLSASRADALSVAWGGDWKTLKSEHFEIHFEDGFQEMARRCLAIAEGVHLELLPFFGSGPVKRTHIVLSDDTDFSNGWATVLPYGRIRLFVAAPSDPGSLESYDEWLHLLIRHEYVHILHMEMGRGAVNAGRKIFGRFPLLFPHVLTPVFLLEGMAVYFESDAVAGYGRLQGSHYAAQMALEVRNGNWKDLQEVVVPLRNWPINKAYLYGAFFIDYLISVYGKDAVAEFLYRQSGELIPFFTLNFQAKRVFGKIFPALWEDFRLAMEERFADGHSEGEGMEERMLPSGNFFHQVTAVAGDDFFLVEDSGKDRRRLFRYTEKGREPIMALRPLSDMDVAEDGRLAVSRILRSVDGRVFHDIFIHMPEVGWKRLTRNQRFSRVRWMPSGESLLVSRQQAGLSELYFLDMEGSMRLLWRGSEGDVLGAFDVDAAGERLVAGLKRAGQGWNLEIMDLATGGWSGLTSTPFMENQPSFMPDGRILFSADYDGVYNVYVMDTETGMLEQWTRSSGGAFSPGFAGNKGLYYQAYTADGFRLMRVDHPAALKAFPKEDVAGEKISPFLFDAIENLGSERKYSPLQSLRPRYWFPVWLSSGESSQLGFETHGSDALDRHSYGLMAAYDMKNDLVNGSLTYACDNRWLLLLDRSHRFGEVRVGEVFWDYTIREDRVTLQRNHLLNFFEDRLALHGGLVHERDTLVDAPSVFSRVSMESNLAGMALTFRDEEHYIHVPGIGWGFYGELIAESNEILDSDYKGAVVQGAIRKIWNLPGPRTLGVRLAGGYADQEAKPFRIGGTRTGEEMRLFGRNEAVLRGYPRSVQTGNIYAAQRLSLTSMLFRVERNWSLMPFGLGDISGSIHVDSGSAWDEGRAMRQLTGAGLELHVELVLGYHFTAPLVLGYARGLDKDLGEDQFYTALGFSF
ncbi:PD40 domain-containing protein [Desulfobotulus mexicanus]|uniref:Bacterial surface antigen (D15) domain-containing protein n=1 Tax=Desulfobotulus mexicanus TaxID=2586642 RepID=A0A5Q4VEW8_9BACT|nr:PD40 domain-containing protein [Desulfobotulus mexicanus]TYT76214.1 hypothetical protein FIM25_01285 [Desulfobotulus mexicanus]